MGNTAQRSFTSGEIAPALYARTDVQRYTSALRTCRNFIVNRYGGVSNRPGTEYAASTKNNGAVRLIPFAFSADQSYVLEFGDRYLRFYQDAGQVVSVSGAAPAWVNGTVYAVADLVTQSGVQYYCIAAHTAATVTNQPGTGSAWLSDWIALSASGSDAIYEIPTPYAADDLSTLQTMQSNDVITIVHPNYAPRELKRYAHTKWTLTSIAFGPSIVSPSNLAVTGGTADTIDANYAVTAISTANGDEGVPATVKIALKKGTSAAPLVLTWDPVPGALTYNVYRGSDGQTFGLIGGAGGVPLPKTNSTWSPNSATASTTLLDAWIASGSQARMTVLSSANDRPSDGSFTITGTISISATNHGETLAGRVRAYYARDGETRVDAGIVASLSLPDVGNGSATFAGSIDVPDNGYAALVLDLVPEVFSDAASGTFSCTVSEASAPNTVTWRSTGTGFSDTGITAAFSSAPPTNPNLFGSPNGYPAAVSSYQQRRMLAATNNAPQQIRGSRTAVPASFTTSTPLEDDDALSFDLASQELNVVRHLRDMGRLVVFASSGEWIVEGDNSNILKPSAINARRFSAHGSASLPPIMIGTAAIYVQARNTVVRDLKVDTVQGITSNDLSVYAAHLFDGYTIADWDFAQIPHAIAWVVRSDGVMLGLTYLPEQDVWGWHRHDTDGTIENVCVIPEGSEDRVYLVVNRTINGVTKRYVERMASRTVTALTDVRDLVFMDAALSYDGRNFDPAVTMTLSGGVAWDETQTITITRSASAFTANSVGSAVVFYDASGAELFRVTITAYTSGTVVTGRPNKSVPVGYQSSPASLWGLAAVSFTGLDHLEGKAVSVLGDGAVVASPNNSEYATIAVAGGAITLPSPSVVVHVGLPYLSDLETLDIDTAGGPSLKPYKMLVSSMVAVVEKSRTFFAGQKPPAGTDPLEKLDIAKFRDVDDNYDLTALKTGDFELTIQGGWNSNGRVFLRQPDPVPTSILAIIPSGMLPSSN